MASLGPITNPNPVQGGNPAKPSNARSASAGTTAFSAANVKLNTTQQSAYDLMLQTLTSWGLASLAPDLRNLIVKGDTSPDTLSLALSQTQAYKTRFAGNVIREKNGLPDLTPAQYIATEEQYKNIMNAYGLPAGFYDTHDALADLIGKDISSQELQTRVQIAHDQYTNAPEQVKNLWSQYFGTKGDAIAAILDPNTATQVIQDRANQVAIGGAAALQGFGVTQQRAQQLEQNGVSLANAQKAYAQIAQSYGTDQNIAQRFGTTFDLNQEENDLLLNQGAATQKRQTLYDEEQGLFHGHAALDQNSLGVQQEH